MEKESENFRVIYRESHSHLTDHLLSSAEKSLEKLKEIFDYIPKEKIIINTYDVYDYGFASATSVPQNFIRLEIEPFEPGYENIPYNERFQWVLSHELVHIVVNDASTNLENFFRSIFAKVLPEQEQPSTIFYSLLTNYSRYTPHWHQEAIAVFWETWLSGGYGRVLGSFDEMYFRTMVNDSKNFPCPIELDSKLTHNSINLEKLFYLYGGRFAAFLAIHYGVDKVVEWFSIADGEFYNNFISKFEDVFGNDLIDVWREFLNFEIEFQTANLKKLSSVPASPKKKLYKNSFGWVTQPFYDKITNNVIFGYHTSGKLAAIQKLNLSSFKSEDIASLPTPSMHQVSSAAFSPSKNRFFFTTNNNQLYRDVWSLHLGTEDQTLLFEDYRVGSITVSDKTNELWGIQHSGGSASLVYSAFPYTQLQNIIRFNVGDEISQLSVSPSGEKLAAIIHRTDGSQILVVSDCREILKDGRFKYETISSKGSPENPSWDNYGETIFWNAFTNGVSNIYRMKFIDGKVEPVSHSLTGLFKPIYISEEKLFAFEYHSDGFVPFEIPNQRVEYLPAIKYMGQEIIELNPDIFKWTIYPNNSSHDSIRIIKEDSYNSLGSLNILTFIPVVSGFQNDVMIGLYTHISDPLITHDLKLEFGITPFDKNSPLPYYHFRGRYDYKKKFEILVEHNAPDFYDLFNERKLGMIGTRVNLSYTNFWLYDNPLKIKQKTDVTYYTGIKFFNDNLLPILVEDFLVAQTVFNSKYLRRSIGSSDYEAGNEFTLTLIGFGQKPKEPDIAGNVYGEWSTFNTWLAAHNVFHLKLAGGYHHDNEDLVQAKFYFGGFGNRRVENKDVKQFRNLFRFPGVPIYSLPAESFGKILIENTFPPIRFSSLSFFGRHYVSHIDISIYSQGLFLDFPKPEKFVNAGAQLSIILKHWFNLESTISVGAAKAWWKGGNNFEWFASIKLLKN